MIRVAVRDEDGRRRKLCHGERLKRFGIAGRRAAQKRVYENASAARARENHRVTDVGELGVGWRFRLAAADGTHRLDLLWPSDGYKLRLADGTTPLGARLCRPSEIVLDILPDAQRGAFSKEDGEQLVDDQGNRLT